MRKITLALVLAFCAQAQTQDQQTTQRLMIDADVDQSKVDFQLWWTTVQPKLSGVSLARQPLIRVQKDPKYYSYSADNCTGEFVFNGDYYPLQKNDLSDLTYHYATWSLVFAGFTPCREVPNTVTAQWWLALDDKVQHIHQFQEGPYLNGPWAMDVATNFRTKILAVDRDLGKGGRRWHPVGMR